MQNKNITHHTHTHIYVCFTCPCGRMYVCLRVGGVFLCACVRWLWCVCMCVGGGSVCVCMLFMHACSYSLPIAKSMLFHLSFTFPIHF